MTDPIFINGKKIKLEGKTPAQLEHLLQLANIAITNYQAAIVNYPPDRMVTHGQPYLDRLQSFADRIESALKSS